MKDRILPAFLASVLITAVAASGFLYVADNAVSDSFYQKTAPANQDIVVFGIDQDTVDALGPVTGLRGAMAQVIETINADPENRPAVIGIDLMYTGENRDAPEADRQLADAASIYANVVVAADAKFGNELVATEDGTYTIRRRSVLDWYTPYAALSESVTYGHINEMLDRDGIFRHAQLYIDIPGRERVLSFARVIYERWCEEKGLTPLDMPQTSVNGFYYLPFSQGNDGYSDGFSFLDLYDGKVDPYFYRGKIVLIGPYASGMQDEYFTSLDHASRMPGVVIQANNIEAFQKGFFPREVSIAAQLALLFLIGFLTAFWLWDRKILPSVLIWLSACIIWLFACRFAYSAGGVILHVLWVPAGVSALFICSVALNYVRAKREQRRITDTFGHYMDPVIRDQLLAQGASALELGGKTRDIAVLFVDVRGFTAMSEALEAETVVEIVNRYLTLTTKCIMNNHGTLDKFVGDCTMAIWNAPVEQDDPVYLACRAAVDMVTDSEALGKELMELYGYQVSFGIGVNWGPAVVGNIGAPKRLDYTAIGDTVNTAARLEANAKGGTILISRAVAEKLGDRAEVLSLGNSIRLKGKKNDFEVLELKRLH